jgi:hypothetical protein
MRLSFFFLPRLRLAAVLLLVGTCVAAWVRSVQAQSHAQIGTSTPLPVYVTNQADRLPEGFTQGSRWRFTTWTAPSVFTWTAAVNSTSGAWANLTITHEDRTSSTRWYYVPAMPGSWERQ